MTRLVHDEDAPPPRPAPLGKSGTGGRAKLAVIGALKKRQPTGLLGLALDGSRLEVVLLRRSNGSVEIQKNGVASLSLDPLKDDPELVGREIRKHLEDMGIRERRCAVCLPLDWALSLQTKLPDLPEADLRSFLEIEAERGFPYGPEALFISVSRFRLGAGQEHATEVAIPREQVLRLEKALRSARLAPVTFSLGLPALQNAEASSSDGVLALIAGDKGIGLQVSSGGGVAALRTIESAFETEAGARRFDDELIAREIRVTLGQLPAGVREGVRRLRIFGDATEARHLAEDLGPRAAAMGMAVEPVTGYGAGEFGVKLPATAAVSPALSLAARHLSGQRAAFEFLPPKMSAWEQITRRYSSKKLLWTGAGAGSVAVMIGLAFLVQGWQLSRLQAKWAATGPKVTELEELQQRIQQFRPWFDSSIRSLSILRKLTEAFPEDGAVSAKTLEIRNLSAVTCSGVARDQQAFLKMLDQLRAATEVGGVTVDQVRGQRPMQFTFNFEWGATTGHEH